MDDLQRSLDPSVVEWLLAWFRERGKFPADGLEERLAVNYFDAGIIDSFGIIELISDIEQKYGVEFSSEDFLDRRFSTIGGLAAILEQRQQSKNNR
jgi:acyl carrier protein